MHPDGRAFQCTVRRPALCLGYVSAKASLSTARGLHRVCIWVRALGGNYYYEHTHTMSIDQFPDDILVASDFPPEESVALVERMR